MKGNEAKELGISGIWTHGLWNTNLMQLSYKTHWEQAVGNSDSTCSNYMNLLYSCHCNATYMDMMWLQRHSCDQFHARSEPHISLVWKLFWLWKWRRTSHLWCHFRSTFPPSTICRKSRMLNGWYICICKPDFCCWPSSWNGNFLANKLILNPHIYHLLFWINLLLLFIINYYY